MNRLEFFKHLLGAFFALFAKPSLTRTCRVPPPAGFRLWKYKELLDDKPRPALEVLRQLRALAALECTTKEIAAVMNMPHGKLFYRISGHNEKWSDFRWAYLKGREDRAIELLRIASQSGIIRIVEKRQA